jgi:hypothetical protein
MNINQRHLISNLFQRSLFLFVTVSGVSGFIFSENNPAIAARLYLTNSDNIGQLDADLLNLPENLPEEPDQKNNYQQHINNEKPQTFFSGDIRNIKGYRGETSNRQPADGFILKSVFKLIESVSYLEELEENFSFKSAENESDYPKVNQTLSQTLEQTLSGDKNSDKNEVDRLSDINSNPLMSPGFMRELPENGSASNSIIPTPLSFEGLGNQVNTRIYSSSIQTQPIVVSGNTAGTTQTTTGLTSNTQQNLTNNSSQNKSLGSNSRNFNSAGGINTGTPVNRSPSSTTPSINNSQKFNNNTNNNGQAVPRTPGSVSNQNIQSIRDSNNQSVLVFLRAVQMGFNIKFHHVLILVFLAVFEYKRNHS